MASTRRIKRRLLSGVVEDNIDLVDDRLDSAARRRRDRVLRYLTRLGLLLVPLAVLGSALYLSLDGGRPLRNMIASAPSLSDLLEDRPNIDGIEPPERERYFGREPAKISSSVFPLPVRTIIVDPGHGGPAHGTVAGGLSEKDIVLDISLRVRTILRDQGFRVALTRDQDIELSLDERVTLANRLDGDIFVSIHINWISARNVRGIETYYLGPTSDPELEELARRENADSGYSLADYRRLLDGIYTDVRGDESEELATAVHRGLFGELQKSNRALRDRGVKTAPFVVLIGTNMPAILAEVSCLSNDEEVELLRTDEYRQEIAEALARGITSYAESTAEPVTADVEKGS